MVIRFGQGVGGADGSAYVDGSSPLASITLRRPWLGGWWRRRFRRSVWGCWTPAILPSFFGASYVGWGGIGALGPAAQIAQHDRRCSISLSFSLLFSHSLSLALLFRFSSLFYTIISLCLIISPPSLNVVLSFPLSLFLFLYLSFRKMRRSATLAWNVIVAARSRKPREAVPAAIAATPPSTPSMPPTEIHPTVFRGLASGVVQPRPPPAKAAAKGGGGRRERPHSANCKAARKLWWANRRCNNQ